MTEDEARQALAEMQAQMPKVGKGWVDMQMQHIRSEGEGYWVPPVAAEYIKQLESQIRT